MEGLSHAQIASVLDLSTGAVKASLSLARKRVADSIDQTSVNVPASAEVNP